MNPPDDISLDGVSLTLPGRPDIRSLPEELHPGPTRLVRRQICKTVRGVDGKFYEVCREAVFRVCTCSVCHSFWCGG